MGQTGPYTACAVLARYGYGARLETAVMALQGVETTSPPAGKRGGLDVAGWQPVRSGCSRRLGSLAGLTRLSTYLSASAILDGETTRRTGLNLDRGSQPLDTQRIAGKREWHRETGKSSPQRVRLRKGQNKPVRVSLGVLRLETVRVPQPKGHKGLEVRHG